MTDMAERIDRAKNDKGEMEFHVIMPAKSGGGGGGGAGSGGELEDRRSQIFSEKHIEDRLITKRAKQPWPVEVLIVDT